MTDAILVLAVLVAGYGAGRLHAALRYASAIDSFASMLRSMGGAFGHDSELLRTRLFKFASTLDGKAP